MGQVPLKQVAQAQGLYLVAAPLKLGAVRHMEEDAVRDEGIAELLKGANGDPKVIEKRVSPCAAAWSSSIKL